MHGSTDYFVRKKVAIIGSGCAGIGALWALNKTYHDVYMYEAADRLGGHTNTVQFKKGKYTTAVDTGFIVLNEATYRMFIGLRQHFRCAHRPHSKFYQFFRQGRRKNRAHGNDLQCISGSWRL